MNELTALRNTWEFRYKASEVHAAAKSKVAHHSKRYKWWESESKKAEQSLKDKGFEYREEQFSRGGEMVIVGDPQLVKRVTDCKRKMEEHREQWDAFETWTRALGGQAEKEPDGELVLKIEDVMFFGL